MHSCVRRSSYVLVIVFPGDSSVTQDRSCAWTCDSYCVVIAAYAVITYFIILFFLHDVDRALAAQCFVCSSRTCCIFTRLLGSHVCSCTVCFKHINSYNTDVDHSSYNIHSTQVIILKMIDVLHPSRGKRSDIFSEQTWNSLIASTSSELVDNIFTMQVSWKMKILYLILCRK